MKQPASLASASGLRPMSAFVVVATVVVVVGARVALLSRQREAAQPDRTVRETGAPPSYEIVDAAGRVLARSVPRFDLVMSPRSMWQAHTPERMARRLSEALGGEPAPSEVLAAMLPGAEDGVLEVEAWDLSARRAYLLEEWIESGAGSGRGRLSGIAIGPVLDDPRPSGPGATGGRPVYRLSWRPAVLLSRAEREHHGYASAWAWARHLAAGLARCVGLEPGASDEDLLATVWSALLPSGFCRPVRGIPSERVLDVRDLLREEGVSTWQMRIAYESDRSYPCGGHELLGSWGYTRPDQTTADARDGLELLARRMLLSEEWSFLDRRPPVYTWLQDRAVRGERANAFLDHRPAASPPAVRTTIDLALLQALRRELGELMEEHRPALALGIVLDVASGDVLAVDSVEAYEVQPFAPVYHAFTPGSTFKLVTMAVALEEGAVTPEQRFDVGHGDFVAVDPRTGSRRMIREAEGSLEGVITASEALAYSVNAGLVQIGLRVPAAAFHARLVALGYGRAPGSGLGIERAGYLAALPWSWLHTQASVCFGHELSTTLWQHATALATIVRGGEHRPLRLLRSVAQDGVEHEVPAAPPVRVLSERACGLVREMMALGASEGTGDGAGQRLLELARAAGIADPTLEGLAVGTKTGTAEKVPTELCLHVEMSERQRCRLQGVPWTRRLYRALKAAPRPHRSCYTSSMCIVARHPEDGRELMVLIVADEPRGKAKYGSEVAGAAAVDVLAEALGLTRDGRVPERALVAGFMASAEAERNPSEQPWREEGL